MDESARWEGKEDMSRLVLSAGVVGALFLSLATPCVAGTGPFTVPVDEGASSVTVTVCIPGGCDTDVSGVSGFSVVALDDGESPGQIELHDFVLSLTDTLNIDISIFLGGLTAKGNDLELLYAEPGTMFGPEWIEDTAFLFLDVPTEALGTVDYNATGTVCIALGATGLPCIDTRDLGEQGTQTGDIGGTVTVIDGIATLTISPDVEVPLAPNNPDLGTLTISGTVVGSAPIPATPIPTLSAWGLIAMTLLTLTAGSVVWTRTRRTAVSR